MTLQVFRGFVGPSQLDVNRQQGVDSQDAAKRGSEAALRQQSILQQINVTSTNITQASEAVVNAVRVSGGKIGSADKIRDYDEAKEVSLKVSDEIRNNKEDASGAHSGLNPESAQSTVSPQ